MPRRTAAEQAGLVARLIEHASDVIAVIDVHGTISFQSPSVEHALGYPPEELDGTTVFDLVHPEDLPGAWKRMSQVQEDPGPTRPSLIRLRHRNGSWRTFEAVGTAMFDDPLVGGIVVNARDVSERLRLERELLQAHKLQAVGRLAAGVAHDFNNLFTVITGHSALLLESLDELDPRRSDAETISDAARRAAQLIRRLLAFSDRAGRDPQMLELNEVVSGLATTLRPLVGENIDLDLELDDEAGTVVCDPTEIEQVILNLVLNARDALGGSGRIVISTSISTLEPDHRHVITVPGGTYASVSVTDNGTGFDEAIRTKLFEPFFTTKDIGKGTGLGLASVQRIMTDNGGTIALESDPVGGTTFSVFFPAVTTEELRPEVRDFVAHGVETVLVVEDDDLVRDLTRRLLEPAGYRVLSTSAAAEALDRLRADGERIDLLLTDVVMPGMRGPELAREGAKLRPELRTLFMSGFAEETLEAEATGPGTRLLTKPFSRQALVEAVRTVLAEQSGTG
jgi:two-component system, cell cycle sensor histidine kinase and response regulator CckA